MDTEIELKLLVPADANNVLENRFFPLLNAQVERSSFTLFNCYYDTQDSDFRKMEMGLRVRGRDGHYEQTIKTAGQSYGGLHQRPEYNVNIEDNTPDLKLFDADIWPQGIDPEQLQNQIQIVFTTHFERQAWLFSFDNGDKVEIVFDQGKIEAGGEHAPICEIEFELKQGNPGRLFEMAQLLLQHLPFRFGIQSKAARGYMLAKGIETQPLEQSGSVSLTPQDNLEQGFIKAVSYSLQWWQHHEQCYLSTDDEQALDGVLTGVRMLGQLLRLYQEQLDTSCFTSLISDLDTLIAKWLWIQELYSLRVLRSERGAFRKKLDKSVELLSYLDGRSQGMLNSHQPDKLMHSALTISVQLQLNQLMMNTPWRQVNDNWQQNIEEFARQSLSESLQQVNVVMEGNDRFNAEQYLHAESRLRNVLFNGVFLADMFAIFGRDQFRAPWLDVLDGIEELHTIQCLEKEIINSDVEQKDKLLDWSREKIQRLLDVMEQSRLSALNMQPYWQ